MPIFSVAIQKGGCAKTTTTLNLAAALSNLGKRVLVIDADPQASLTQSLGIVDEPEQNFYTELSKEMKGETGELANIIIKTRSGLDLVPSSIELASAELELVSVYGREQVFSWMLDRISNKYDFIFIDCPPAIGMLTVNALVASDFVLMPMQAEFLPLKGVRSFMHHLKALNKLNKKLEVLGFVITRYDERKTMNRQMLQELEREFGDKVFHAHIRNNIQLAKAQEAGLDIFSFDKKSHGAEDYAQLANEFLDHLKTSNTVHTEENFQVQKN